MASLTLTRMTGAVRRRHPVPVFGADPLAWAEAMLDVLDREHYDVLLPTQEQVAVLALVADRIAERGVATAVPAFAAVRRVQDKPGVAAREATGHALGHARQPGERGGAHREDRRGPQVAARPC